MGRRGVLWGTTFVGYNFCPVYKIIFKCLHVVHVPVYGIQLG